jgi:tricorn protease
LDIAMLRLAFVLLSGLSAAAQAELKFMRYPDVCGDAVVFTYAGDLWRASTQGGSATRLTAAPGLEFVAKFSPDCRSLAFTGQLDGDEQVYVMPATGGEPRQLTFYPAMGPLPQRWGFDNQVYGWTADGQSVVFKSTYNAFEAGDQRAYTILASGGLPEALPMPISGALDLAPDGARLVYSPLSNDHRAWKKYEGGWAQDLWLFDRRTNQTLNLTQHRRTDRDPMWIGESVYFVSDRDGRLNLYRVAASGGAATALTTHRDADIKFASSDGNDQIVYERDGVLTLYSIQANAERTLAISVPADDQLKRHQRVDANESFQSMSVSADGKRVLVVARGELFSLPTESGVTRNLSQSSDAHEREASFSADGKQIVYVSDRSGEEAIYVRAADASSPERKLTTAVYGRLYAPRFSPNGKYVAFGDSEGRLHLLQLSAPSSVRELANDPAGVLTDFSFSPGSAFLAYSISQANGMNRIDVVALEGGTARTVTDPNFSSFNPQFSADSKHLYFLSQREFAPQIDGAEWNYARDRQSGVYALSLRADGDSPIPFRNDEAGPAKADDDKNEDSGPSNRINDAIDFDGLSLRVTRLPIDADNWFNLSAHRERLLLQRTDAFHYGRSGRAPVSLHAFSLTERKLESLSEGFDAAVPATNGAVIVLREGDAFNRLEVGKDETSAIATTGLQIEIDPAQEWSVVFEEVWRRFRDHFYVSNMHGYDWNAIGAKYRALKPKVGHRADLNYLLSDMVGELNTSHAYVSGGDLGVPDRPNVALLGARFVVNDDRYVIASIFAGQNEEPLYRSPLTEVGVDAEVGDVVLEINGRALTGSDNLYQRLRLPAGERVELTLKRPDRDEPHRALIEPLASETSLKYLTWVNANRRYVDDVSGGTIGYLHIPDMGADGIREFIKWYYPQIRKQGLIVDVRGNGGGNVSQMLIERLNRRLLANGFARGAELGSTYPQQVFHGHQVALISETSASDGDIFPHMFRQVGLGPLIGKRTWGGVVGVTDWGPLIDGGSVNVPQFGFAGADGQWIIEGEGVSPDIEVDNDLPSLLAGKDNQLDRGIQELQAKIAAEPKALPPEPAAPIK